MVVGGRGREIIYLSLHCHHQNDSCIKVGSDESHFNVSVGSDGQSHRTVSTDHNLFQEKGEPKRYRTEVLPLTNLTPYRWAKPAYGSRPLRSITDRLSRTELLELPIGRFSEAGLLEGMRFVIFLT